jgi:hypothetical protein
MYIGVLLLVIPRDVLYRGSNVSLMITNTLYESTDQLGLGLHRNKPVSDDLDPVLARPEGHSCPGVEGASAMLLPRGGAFAIGNGGTSVFLFVCLFYYVFNAESMLL